MKKRPSGLRSDYQVLRREQGRGIRGQGAGVREQRENIEFHSSSLDYEKHPSWSGCAS
jgi:hypothetical protein